MTPIRTYTLDLEGRSYAQSDGSGSEAGDVEADFDVSDRRDAFNHLAIVRSSHGKPRLLGRPDSSGDWQELTDRERARFNEFLLSRFGRTVTSEKQLRRWVGAIGEEAERLAGAIA